MKKLIVLAIAALALPALVSAATSDTPGVTSSSILIGGTIPLSGPASAYQSVGRGADAYFKYANAHGGVNGRKIVYKFLDDGYDPAQTVQQTRQLVQQDGVFAIYNSLGTEQNLATRDYLNSIKVPQLFVASGASTWGRDYKQYPYTIGYQPSYVQEGTVYGRYIARTKPGAKVAVLYQDDDYGKDLLSGFLFGLKGKAKIVAREGYDVTAPDVGSQIAKLKAAKADTLMNFATPKFAIQAYVFANKLGWHPQVYVNAVSSASNIMTLATLGTSKRQTTGSLSITFLKDPTDPQWANDPAIKLYRQIMRQYNPRGDAKDVYNVYGMASAFTMVDTLKRAGKNLTREGAVNAATHLDETNNPFVLPGIVVKTTPSDHFPLAQARLERWDGKRWIQFGPLFNTR